MSDEQKPFLERFRLGDDWTVGFEGNYARRERGDIREMVKVVPGGLLQLQASLRGGAAITQLVAEQWAASAANINIIEAAFAYMERVLREPAMEPVSLQVRPLEPAMPAHEVLNDLIDQSELNRLDTAIQAWRSRSRETENDHAERT